MAIGTDIFKTINEKLIYGGIASGVAAVNPTSRNVTSVKNEQRSVDKADEKKQDQVKQSVSGAGKGDPAINAFKEIDSRRAEILSSVGLNGSMERMMDVNQELGRLSVSSSLLANIVHSKKISNELLINRLLLGI